MHRVFETELAGRPLRVETGRLAQLANGSCLVRYGETVILSTATSSKTPRPGIDFFPLSVDYEEKMYSVGKIPGGFIKREGRPSEKAILTSRAIDRPMRPLFPKDLRNDVCINNLVLSVDQDCAPDITAMIGSSIAVAISDIPWNGPTCSLALGYVDGQLVINPNEEERQRSEMDVTLAGTEEKVCMIEAGANEIPDDVMLDCIIKGHAAIQEVCRFIKSIVRAVGKPKYSYESAALPADLQDAVNVRAAERMKTVTLEADKIARDAAVYQLVQDTAAAIAADCPEHPEWPALVPAAVDILQKKTVRHYLFDESRRVDGRGMDEIRPLSAEVGLLPRVHGSALFQRGFTQVMTSCTLAPLSKVQILDGLDSNEEHKRYMHHYNFPGYSTGEAKPNRSPGRREIGHGALAERSLLPVLPSIEDFPYAIRNVSEVMMSNGSTSQASVCASTLALMDAGVPIKRPVAGISCGLICNPENHDDYKVFMDIQGIEDFFGDMDFKVAGTTEGITAIQVDIKVDGLSYDIIRDAFAMTRKGRMQILDEVIRPCLLAPRQELSAYAPKIIQTVVPVDKIRAVIGQGGKVINRIIDETGAQIDIEDDGHVYISAVDAEAGEKALAIVNGIVHDPEPGQVFEGEVTRLMNFGAFVEYLPGKEGLVHISKLAWERVDQVEDVVQVGDHVRVMVSEIDDQGRVNLSMRDCMEKPEGYEEPEEDERGGRGRGDRRPPRGGRGERGGRSDRGDRAERGGPSRGGFRRRDRDGGHFRD